MATATRVLQLSPARPDADALGGVTVHVAALAEHAPASVTTLTAYPSGDELLVEAWKPRRLVAALPLTARALDAALAGTNAGVLHVHSPQFGPDAIVTAVKRAGVRLVVAMHEHALVCENYELLEGGRRYCGIPTDLARCDRCLAVTRARPAGSLGVYRATAARLVDAADVFVAPSRSVAELAARVHPALASRVRHLPWGVPLPLARRGRMPETGPLRVAIVGVWARVKGTEVLPALLEACRHLDVEWHLFGATEGASLAGVRRSGARIVVHGAYRRPLLATRLVHAGCHVVALPSIGAETFSLALGEVTAAGFPVLASDLGALGERVRDGALGWLFDPFTPASFADAVSRLVANRAELERVAVHVATLPLRDERDMARDHATLWTELGALAPRPADSPSSGQSREESLATYAKGVARAGSRRPSRLEALFDRLKKSDFYRDLRLRQILPEGARKAIEQGLRRPSYRRPRAKDR
ncbi:MAG TPA: glycosyltransferase [Polyangiaceae bacterium]|jgi:glycosyltransferase involved in cell wall biosynthesis|nr:glycosyltransferase [Polyangiaceae bacterium]